jgi:hypothetical protein
MKFVDETVSRRTFLTGTAVAGLSLLSRSASAGETVNLGLPGGVDTRELIANFSGKANDDPATDPSAAARNAI